MAHETPCTFVDCPVHHTTAAAAPMTRLGEKLREPDVNLAPREAKMKPDVDFTPSGVLERKMAADDRTAAQRSKNASEVHLTVSEVRDILQKHPDRAAQSYATRNGVAAYMARETVDYVAEALGVSVRVECSACKGRGYFMESTSVNPK